MYVSFFLFALCIVFAICLLAQEMWNVRCTTNENEPLKGVNEQVSAKVKESEKKREHKNNNNIKQYIA